MNKEKKKRGREHRHLLRLSLSLSGVRVQGKEVWRHLCVNERRREGRETMVIVMLMQGREKLKGKRLWRRT